MILLLFYLLHPTLDVLKIQFFCIANLNQILFNDNSISQVVNYILNNTPIMLATTLPWSKQKKKLNFMEKKQFNM